MSARSDRTQVSVIASNSSGAGEHAGQRWVRPRLPTGEHAKIVNPGRSRPKVERRERQTTAINRAGVTRAAFVSGWPPSLEIEQP